MRPDDGIGEPGTGFTCCGVAEGQDRIKRLACELVPRLAVCIACINAEFSQYFQSQRMDDSSRMTAGTAYADTIAAMMGE